MTSDKDKGTIVQVLDFSLFAEYFQFYIQDAETDETLPVHWEPEDEDALALVASEVIAVRTVRETDVAVSIEILDTKPSEDEDLTDWDHVIECTLELPGGRLLVTATSEDVYESRRVELEPGNH